MIFKKCKADTHRHTHTSLHFIRGSWALLQQGPFQFTHWYASAKLRHVRVRMIFRSRHVGRIQNTLPEEGQRREGERGTEVLECRQCSYTQGCREFGSRVFEPNQRNDEAENEDDEWFGSVKKMMKDKKQATEEVDEWRQTCGRQKDSNDRVSWWTEKNIRHIEKLKMGV